MNYRKTIGSQSFRLIIPVIFSFILLSSFPASALEGTLKWSIDIGVKGGGISSPLVGVNGTIYVESGDDLYAINPDGSQKWVLTGAGTPQVIGDDGTIYAGSLHAINPNGTQKWVLTGVGGAQAIGADGTIYTRDGLSIYAINPDGTKKWVFTIDVSDWVEVDGFSRAILGADGTIYLTGWGSMSGAPWTGWYPVGSLFAINSDGSFKWKLGGGGSDWSNGGTPAIGYDGTIYAVTSGCYWNCLYAVNPDGSEKWTHEVGQGYNNVSSVTIGVDGTIYLQGDVGEASDSDCDGLALFAVNPDGTTKWCWDDGGGWAPAVGDDGTIYAGPGGTATMYALNPDSTKKWELNFCSGGSELAIGADGTIYAGFSDCDGQPTLKAINSSSTGLANSSWPMFMHDERHTGRAPSKFIDVTSDYWAEDAIYRIYNTGITTGCSKDPVMYCPENPVNRDQMAVFLGRAKHGSNFIPPDATGIFTDVPKWYWAAHWIEQFYKDGLTKGCKIDPHDVQSPVMYYCPKYPVTRTTMAIFLLRAKHGANYQPPAATGIFEDVEVNYWAADWIEQLYREGITTGCKKKPLMYCPSMHVTRAQMAVFITRTFGLTLKDGLVADYPFNGNANDESGNGHHGTVHGATLTADRFGNSNSAYSFDGIDDYIEIPELLYPSIKELSFAAWAWIEEGKPYGHIIYKGTSEGEATLWFSSNKARFDAKLSDGSWNVAEWDLAYTNSFILLVGNYHRGSHLELWINGELKATKTIPAYDLYSQHPGGDTSSSIGAYNQRQQGVAFEGLIDDVLIYNRALSESEIKALYYRDE